MKHTTLCGERLALEQRCCSSTGLEPTRSRVVSVLNRAARSVSDFAGFSVSCVLTFSLLTAFVLTTGGVLAQSDPYPPEEGFYYQGEVLMLDGEPFTEPAQTMATCSGSPCDAARWTGGASWNPDGTINESGPAPKGIIKCGSSAETQSNIPTNSCYHASDFTIDVEGFPCVEPSSGNTVYITNPHDHAPVLWLNFDVRPSAGIFQIQINDNEVIGWALYASNTITNGVSGPSNLSGDCSDLFFVACGLESANTWNTLPVPNFAYTTNYYMAIWKLDGTNLMLNNFKARFGCGDAPIPICNVDINTVETVCNDNGTYTAYIHIGGVNGQYVAHDPNSITGTSSPICLTNNAVNNPVTTGTLTLVYNQGVNWDIDVYEVSPSTINNCNNPTNSADCYDSRSGSAPACCGLEVTCPSGGPFTFACLSQLPAADYSSVAASNACGEISITHNDVVSGGAGCIGDAKIITRTYTVSDDQNTVECVVVYHIIDNIAPQIGQPGADAIINCPAEPVFTAPSATDNCDETPSVVLVSDVTVDGSCAGTYVRTKTWKAVDNCGNESSTVSQSITVQDITAPSIDCPADVEVNCAGDVPAADISLVSASDACGGVTVTHEGDEITGQTCANQYVIERTYRATDDCGLYTDCVQYITVFDDVAPEIGQPGADATISCPAIPLFTAPTATDNCGGTPQIVLVSDVTEDGDCDGTYVRTRTWKAVDACGNESATVSQSITVEDSTEPTITCPGDISVSCAGEVPAADISLVIASDACSNLTVTHEGDVITNQECANRYVIERTYRAEDGCGLSVECIQYITVNDETAPQIGNPGASATINCPAEPVFTAPSATDNCGETPQVVLVSDVTVDGACAGVYVRTQTWKAIDACGNESGTVSQSITVQDITAPTIQCPANIQVTCAGDVPAADVSLVSASDACGDVTVTHEGDEITQQTCANRYVIERTYRATDDCGLFSECVQYITVYDNIAPVIGQAGANATIECPAQPQFVAPTATDNCGGTPTIVLVSDVTTDGECEGSYSRTRTWKAVDACGNESGTVSQTINVEDTTDPVLSGTPAANIGIACYADLPAPAAVTAFDACLGALPVTYTQSETNEGSSCNNQITRTWYAVDDCGNDVTFVQTINVNFGDAPSFDVTPAPVVNVSCYSQVPPVAQVSASASCGSVNVTFSEVQTNQGSSCNNVITRTWVAESICGDDVTFTQTINVNDTTLPTISCPANVNVSCAADVPAPNVAQVNASDNCGSVVVTHDGDNITQYQCDNRFVIQRKYKAVDACGNTAYCTQLITVYDNVAPVFTYVPNELIECGNEADGSLMATAVDNCGGLVEITYNDVIDCGDYQTYTIGGWGAPNSTAANYRDANFAAAFPNGLSIGCANASFLFTNSNAIEVFLPAGGGDGLLPSGVTVNPASGSNFAGQLVAATLNVQFDYYDPNFGGAPTNLGDLIYAGGTFAGMTVNQVLAIANDVIGGCSVAYSPGSLLTAMNQINESYNGNTPTGALTCDDSEFNVQCQYSVIRHWFATDECGNVATAQQNLSVADTTPPAVVFMPQDITIECGQEEALLEDPIFQDNCSDEVTVQYFQTLTESDCGYELHRVWRASDDCDNFIIVEQHVIVQDITAPVIQNVPANTSYECDEVVPGVTLTAIDNCDGVLPVTYVDTTAPAQCGHVITRTFSAVDICGNVGTAVQLIHIVDTTVPTVVSAPQAVITVECGDDIPYVEPVFTDNCDESLTLTAASSIAYFDCGYQISRSWTATDDCNNSTTVSQIVNVVDTTVPVADFVPANVTFECDEDIVYESPVFSDVCDNELNVQPASSIVQLECGYQIHRSWTATDDCNNSITVSQTITVTDTTAPVAVYTPEDAVFECGEEVIYDEPSFTDNCDENLDIFPASSISQVDCGYIIYRSWTAVDDCGNSETVSQEIWVGDFTAPYLVSGVDNVQTVCGADEEIPVPVFADNCDEELVITHQDINLVQNGCARVFDRVYTATDDCGNSTDFVQHIELGDDAGPEISGVEEDIYVQCIDDVPGPSDATAYDNCDGDLPVITFGSWTGAIEERCDLTTAFGPGPDWAFWLPTLATDGYAASAYYHFDANGGQFEQYADGTARLYGTVVNSVDATQKFALDMWFENRSNWTEWSALGRSYKDDLNCATPGMLYQNWKFWELVNDVSVAVGQDALSGVTLQLQHMPANYYFGFQLGQGANNRNCNYGLSGWFTYTGFANCEPISGIGDVNVDADCEPVNFDSNCSTSYTYVYRATDSSGNLTSVVQTIHVEDTIAPEFVSCPADITVNCAADVPAVPTLEANDNCGGDVVIVALPEVIEGDEPCDYIITRTWYAEDECGNRSYCIQEIHVIDNVAPVFTFVPADITVQCDQPVPFVNAQATDNCSSVTITSSDSEYDGDACSGQIVRTFYAVDACGNQSLAVQVITIEDSTDPVFDDFVVYFAVECDQFDNVAELTATDNCSDEVTITYTDQLNSGGCLGVVMRTYTATDDCGNSATAVQYITIQDTTPPVINAPENLSVECDAIPSIPSITATDNCGYDVIVSVQEQIIPGECENEYTIIWNFTAVDFCDNVSTATTTITVTDTTDPVWTWLPENLTVECTDVLPAVVYPTATDNCDDDVEVILTESTLPGDCANEYTVVRIFRAYDNCGNQAMYVQYVYVEDTTAPVFDEQESNFTYECDSPVPLITPSVSDACGNVASLTYQDNNQLTSACAGAIIRTWTAVDLCGNSSTFVQTLGSVDTTAPVFAGQIEINLPCDNSDGIYVTATDNCDLDVTISYSDQLVSGGCQGRILRTYTASDDCGNSSQFVQIITLTDVTAPVASGVEASFTVECGDEYSVDVPSFTDNCDDELDLNSWTTESVVGCATVITYFWSAEDNCENVTTVSTTVTIVDTTPPSLQIPADYSAECSDDLVFAGGSAFDICDGEVQVTVSQQIVDGDCPQSYMIIRTFTAVDACNNTATAQQTITVADTTAPVFGAQGSVFSYECSDAIPLIVPSVTDNCGEVTLSFSDDTSGIESACSGAVVRTWTATDECNNSSTFTQYFSVTDETAPVITGTIEINRPCDDVEGIFVTASDNCDLDVQITYSDLYVSGGCQGRIIRTYTAADDCGNIAQFTQFITLTDAIAPVASGAGEAFTVECGDEYSVDVPSFTDNCDEELEINAWTQESVVGCATVITYFWSAEDNCENVTTVSTTVTIVDTTPPSLQIPADYSAECSDDLVFAGGSAFDICDGEVQVTVSQQIVDGDCPQSYTIIRTFTAVDACNNTATAQQTITVADTTAPVFGAQGSVFSYECSDAIPYIVPSVTDNCGEVTLSFSDDTSGIESACSGAVVRTWTATDECNNSSTFAQYFSVTDETAPVIAGTIEINLPCDNSDGIYVTASDNCDLDVTITYSDVLVSGGCQGRILRTYTASDDCGNSSQFVQIITLTDVTAPVASGVEASFTVECGDEYSVDVPSFTDNCDDELDLNSWTTESVVGCATVITYFWSAEDNCENVTTVSTTVTIVDTTPPSLQIPADYSAECSDDLVFAGGSAFDICDGEVQVTVSQQIVDGDCPQSYTIIRTFTAVDACNNTATAQQTITVADTTAPVFGAQGSVFSYECSDAIPLIVPSVTDNCGEVTLSFSDDTSGIESACSGAVVRTWTATDECNNSSTFAQYFSVYDETAPVITGIFEINLPCDNNAGVYVSASDNCDLDVTITYFDQVVSGGCEGRIIRTYTATDDCGNSSQFAQIITLTDVTAPVASGVGANFQVECGDEYSVDAPSFTDNCDEELDINAWTQESVVGCATVITYYWSAEDNCENVTVVSTTVTIVDTTDPYFTYVPVNLSVSCEDLFELQGAVAADNCDADVQVVVSDQVTDGDCPNSYTLVRTFTATDDCGNTATAQQVIVVSDDTAPVFTSVPEGGYYSCEDVIDFGTATATDNCGAAVVTFADETDYVCVNTYVIVRTWTATDACNNATSTTVTYYVYDNIAPEFDQDLSDIYVECVGDIPAPVAVTATDNCGTATVTVSTQVIESDDCGNQIILVSYVATDECENDNVTSYYIYVNDETAPVLSEMPVDLVIECGSDWPVAPAITALDNCQGLVSVEFEEFFFGTPPAEGSIADCQILTPARPANNPCNYPVDWAMALFGLPSSHRYYQVSQGQFIQYPNGTIQVIATLHNAYNPSNGFNVSVEFVNGLSWAQWSNQAFLTGFKADCGGVAANHPNWMYYLLNNSNATLTGFGGYAGSVLNLAHAPANNYFGFQLGDGANNYNGVDNAFGGWFSYAGTFLVNGEQITSGTTSGAGDFAFELDCCPDYSIVRCWTAVDCSENVTQHCQTISYAPVAGGTAGQTVDVDTDVIVGNGNMINVFPNPASGMTTFAVTAKVSDEALLEVFDVAGKKVAILLNMRMAAGQEYRVNFDVTRFANGVYMYRFMNGDETEVGRLMVSK